MAEHTGARKEIDLSLASDELVLDVADMATATVSAELVGGADWDSAVLSVTLGPGGGVYAAAATTLSADGVTAVIDCKGFAVLRVAATTLASGTRRVMVTAHADDAG